MARGASSPKSLQPPAPTLGEGATRSLGSHLLPGSLAALPLLTQHPLAPTRPRGL